MMIPEEHTLAGVDNDLLQETLGALQAGDMSAALHMLREDEATFVAKNLKAAVIASKCECGQNDCNTYRFVVPEKPQAVSFHMVRLLVRGEMNLQIDSDGDIYKLERIYDLEGPRTAYCRRLDGSWQQTEIP